MFRAFVVSRGVALSLQPLVVAMSRSSLDLRHSSWATRVIVVAMAMLVLVVGFCVFDGSDHDGTDRHASLDLCLGMLTVSLPVVLTGELPLMGSTATYRFAQFTSFEPNVPAPPPKPVS